MNSPFSAAENDPAPFSAEDFAKALEQHDYQFTKGQVVRGKVFETNSEGAYIDIGGKSPGFLPLREAATHRIENLEEVLPPGEEREFLVVREQNAEGQVLLSVRQLELRQSWERLEEIREKEETIDVIVTGTNRGGVTVEVLGLRGFIPRSHAIDRDNLDALVGRQIPTTVLEIDRDREKLVLSYRLAARASQMGQLILGDLTNGTVVNLKPYGAFVDIGGITGLLHVREISRKRIESIESLLEVGQKIKVTIANIDEWKGRVSLSIKGLEAYPGEIVEHFDAVMDTAEERWQKMQAEAGQKPAPSGS